MDKYEGIAKLIFEGKRDKRNFELARNLCKSQKLDSDRIERMIQRAEQLANIEELAENLKEFAKAAHSVGASISKITAALNSRQTKFAAGGYLHSAIKQQRLNSGEYVIKKI